MWRSNRSPSSFKMPISRARRVGEFVAGFYFLLVSVINIPSPLLLLLMLGFSDSGQPAYSSSSYLSFFIIALLSILLSITSLITAIAVGMHKTWGRILGVIVSLGALLFAIYTAANSANTIAIMADISILIDIFLIIFFVSYFSNKYVTNKQN